MSDEINDLVNEFSDPSTPSDIGVEESAPIAPTPTEYEYTARGQKIKEPIDKILQRASQGYDYAQSMSEFNKQKMDFDKRYGAYTEIDKYAQQNPDWWEHVRTQYDQRAQAAQAAQSQNQTNVDPEIRRELDEIKKFKSEIEQEKIAKQRESEDLKYREEFESIRKQHKNLDFDSPGPDGKSLEVQILQYAIDNNIKSFKTAFRDFYHDKLIERAREEGKESAAKEVAKRSKLGLLGETRAPTKDIKQATNIRNKTYDDLYQEALEEFGISTKQRA